MDGDFEIRLEEERARIEARYREVLKNSVAFEKRIRNRWREKSRDKNARIAALEQRVADLEKELANRNSAEGTSMDLTKKREKLLSLMVNDLGTSGLDERGMAELEEQVQAMSGEDLDKTLAERLDLPRPVDASALEEALVLVPDREKLSGEGARGDFTGAPDMSHEGRPEERR